MQANLTAVMDGLATLAAGLAPQVYAYPVEAVTVPCVVVGYPVTIDQAVANLANDVQGIGFGNWREAYIVRHVKDVQILVNPYAATGYVVYDAWARMDGTVQDATAYVTMEGTT